mmetsp:Transcript_21556/g.56917  ORF Transcript_21556/g.56917 Transcript_21556/m.56917 type:complete len:161 (+) Transcript_21556:432-914(+)
MRSGSNFKPPYSYWHLQTSFVSQAALLGINISAPSSLRGSFGRRHWIFVARRCHQTRRVSSEKAPFRYDTKVRRCSSCSTEDQLFIADRGPGRPALSSGRSASVGSGGGVGFGFSRPPVFLILVLRSFRRGRIALRTRCDLDLLLLLRLYEETGPYMEGW